MNLLAVHMYLLVPVLSQHNTHITYTKIHIAKFNHIEKYSFYSVNERERERERDEREICELEYFYKR